jgi:MFS family permease
VTPFRKLWLAQGVSLLGDYIVAFAVQVAVVFRMHGTAADMAGVFIASLLPTAVLGPVAGVFADRWNPRTTMIASDAVRAVLIVALSFATNLPQMYAISFAVSCASSFFVPARSIATPLLVPREKLVQAAAIMQQTMQAMRIVSPMAAAALVSAMGERACYWADSLSFLFSGLMIATIDLPSGPVRSGTMRARVLFDEFAVGLRFLFTDARFSLIAISMTAATFASGCFGALASVYVRDILRDGAPVLGALSSLIGIGTLAGSTLLARWGTRKEPEQWIAIGMASVGSAILLMAAIGSRSLALTASAILGFGVAMVMTGCTALLQGKTPAELRGRVSGASASLASTAQLAAMTLSATWAAWVGVRGMFVLSGAILLLVSAGTILRHNRSELRESDRPALRQDAA